MEVYIGMWRHAEGALMVVRLNSERIFWWSSVMWKMENGEEKLDNQSLSLSIQKNMTHHSTYGRYSFSHAIPLHFIYRRSQQTEQQSDS